MSVQYEEWDADGTRLLAVDASDHVPDRRAFAAAHCGDDDPTVAGPGDRTTDTAGRDGTTAAAEAMLFLAPNAAPTPPRVVTTLVGPDGRRPVSPVAVRVAAAWTADRTGATAVMVDTLSGTRRATVEGDGGSPAAVEVSQPPPGSAGTDGAPTVASDGGATVRRANAERVGAGSLPAVPPRQVE